jgi:hypothetical protein
MAARSYQRRHLRHRDTPIAGDVNDALKKLIERDKKHGLPRAYTLGNVAMMLIDIAHTKPDGTRIALPPASMRATYESFHNRLRTSATFQAGYKQYEKASGNVIVPGSDFFFKNEVGGAALAQLLKSMSAFEIQQSLVSRVHRVADQQGSYVLDADGDILESGSIAGVIIFAADSRDDLLAAWLKRRAKMAVGQLDSAVGTLARALPKSKTLPVLVGNSQIIAKQLGSLPSRAAATPAAPTPAQPALPPVKTP